MEEKKPVKFDAHNIIHDAGNRVIYYYQTEIDHLTAELKAKDELLNKLAGYTAQNLNQEVLVRLIKQALKGE